jgi:HEAT repeat protein
MSRTFPLVALALVAGLGAPVLGHGGAYRAPGDTAPPAASGTGSSGGGGTTAPSTGGSSTPGGPGQSSGGGAAPSSGTSSGSSAGFSATPDLTRWQAWWGFNKDAFLDLKARLHIADVLVGSDEAFLGRPALARDELRPSQDDVFTKVVPALLELLERERSNDILSGALVALAKIGDAPGENRIAGRIAPFLADPNQELAETAAVALGILGSQSQVELLRAILEGDLAGLRERGVELKSAPSERTRAFAAYGLGLVGYRNDGPVRERIAAILSGWMRREAALAGQDDVPVACVVALGLVPLPSDPFATQPAGFGAPPARVCSFEEQVEWMLALLEQRQTPARVRAHVPIALARLLRAPQGRRSPLRKPALERLAARLSKDLDEHADVRVGCVIALGQLATAGPEDAGLRARLMRAREELHEPGLGHFALISLGRASGRAGFDAEPFAALGSGPGNSRAFLLEQLSGASSASRCYAALALGLLERAADEAGQSRSEVSLAALRKAFADAKAPDEVGAYAIALGIARDKGASELLRQRFESVSDADARGHVAVALGLAGDRASIVRIQEVVAASRFQPELLRQAALALGLLGDKDVVPKLFDMLAHATSLSSQAAIASALGLIGDARSLDSLIAMTRDREQRTDLARAFAAVALGMCADKESLPWNAKLATDANYRANTSTLYSPDTGTGILDIL